MFGLLGVGLGLGAVRGKTYLAPNKGNRKPELRVWSRETGAPGQQNQTEHNIYDLLHSYSYIWIYTVPMYCKGHFLNSCVLRNICCAEQISPTPDGLLY